MKKLLFIAALCCLSFASANAQQVFNRILTKAQGIAQDKTMDLEKRKVATFEVDALNYMAMKTREVNPDAKVIELDRQALAMYEFVNMFLDEITRANKKKDRLEVVRIFKETSVYYVRFHDTDKEMVMSYYDNPKFITQFSLDTDWEKALAEVKRVMTLVKSHNHKDYR